MTAGRVCDVAHIVTLLAGIAVAVGVLATMLGNQQVSILAVAGGIVLLPAFVVWRLAGHAADRWAEPDHG